MEDMFSVSFNLKKQSMVRMLEDPGSYFEGSFRKQVDTFPSDHLQANSATCMTFSGKDVSRPKGPRARCGLLHLSRPLECRMCGEEIDPREDPPTDPSPNTTLRHGLDAATATTKNG